MVYFDGSTLRIEILCSSNAVDEWQGLMMELMEIMKNIDYENIQSPPFKTLDLMRSLMPDYETCLKMTSNINN